MGDGVDLLLGKLIADVVRSHSILAVIWTLETADSNPPEAAVIAIILVITFDAVRENLRLSAILHMVEELNGVRIAVVAVSTETPILKMNEVGARTILANGVVNTLNVAETSEELLVNAIITNHLNESL